MPTIGTASGVVIFSGPKEVSAEHQATLRRPRRHPHLGAEIGRAAAFDVALLDFFWTSMTGLVHAFALASREGVGPEELAPFLAGIGAIMPPIAEEFARHHTTGEHPGDESTIVLGPRRDGPHRGGRPTGTGSTPRSLRAALDLADRAIEGEARAMTPIRRLV